MSSRARVIAAVLVLILLGFSAAIFGVRHQQLSVERRLTERLRHAYGLPQSSSSSPLQTLTEVMKEGMLPSQVDSLIALVSSDLLRVEWFAVQSPTLGPVGVAQGLSFDSIRTVYIYYFDGTVAYIRDEHRAKISPITADDARRLLDRDLKRERRVTRATEAWRGLTSA